MKISKKSWHYKFNNWLHGDNIFDCKSCESVKNKD